MWLSSIESSLTISQKHPASLKFICLALLLFLIWSVSSSVVHANTASPKFEQVIRVGFIPHSAFILDNGLPSGALASVMECAMNFFPQVEYVEMPNYERLMFALETSVVDMGLNMVRSKERDKLAQYAVDIYRSRILLVTRDDGNSRQSLDAPPVGRLGARLGTDIDRLLKIKGFKVDVNAYTVERLMEMFRSKHVNSFAESEMAVFDYLKTLDEMRFAFDYRVLSEEWGGAYLAKEFHKKHPEVIQNWKKVVNSCRYLAPELR